MLSYFQIISELKNLCAASKSGTMFIKTQDNKSARFSLEEGKIVGCCYRQTKGYDALPLVMSIESGTYSFNEHSPLGTPYPALPKTDELISILSNKKAATSQPPSDDQDELGLQTVKIETLTSKNDVIFAEMKNILTEFVGPMSSVLFSGYARDKDRIMSDVVEFEHMIDDLASQIGNPKESEEFKTRILDMVNEQI